jgi:DNA repair ATPase RecN
MGIAFTYFDPQQLYGARQYLDDMKAELSHLQRREEETKQDLAYVKHRAEAMKKARIVIQIVAQETQKNLEYHLTLPVTDAVAHVFPDDGITFIARIEARRGKTECDLLFEEGGNEYKPLKGSGYGAVNVACFILRICFWGLKKNRPTFILDEPFRDVSPDLQYKVSEMVKRISEKLGIQIIMVSHAEEINVAANKTFVTEKKKGITKIKELA